MVWSGGNEEFCLGYIMLEILRRYLSGSFFRGEFRLICLEFKEDGVGDISERSICT